MHISEPKYVYPNTLLIFFNNAMIYLLGKRSKQLPQVQFHDKYQNCLVEMGKLLV